MSTSAPAPIQIVAHPTSGVVPDTSVETLQPASGTAISGRIQHIFMRVSAHLQRCNDKEVQGELAKILALIPDLEDVGCGTLMGLAEVAISCLLRPSPDVALASQIREGIIDRIDVLRKPIVALRRGASSPAKVVLGMVVQLAFLALLLMVAIALASGLSLEAKNSIANYVHPKDMAVLGGVLFIGAVGSAVSIMVRIEDFAKLRKTDASVLFLTGFFKPLIGVSFAFFIYCILESSGVAPAETMTTKAIYFVLAMSFVAGFSERMAQDVASRAEKSIPSTLELP